MFVCVIVLCQLGRRLVTPQFRNLYEQTTFLVGWVTELCVTKTQALHMRLRCNWDVLRFLQRKYHDGQLGPTMENKMQLAIVRAIEQHPHARWPFGHFQIELDRLHSGFVVRRICNEPHGGQGGRIVFEDATPATMYSAASSVRAPAHTECVRIVDHCCVGATDHCCLCVLCLSF